MRRGHGLRGVVTALLAGSALPAHAQNSRIEMLERQVAEQQERIARLEAMLGRPATIPPAPSPPTMAAMPLAPPPPQAVPAPAALGIAGLDVSGDLRIREEFNFSDADARDRTRSVLRARLRATYRVMDHISVGAQIATGDPDDPNSTDITLGGFDNDLDVSLDQVWVGYRSGGLTAYAGKFPQIFQRTDMVWDGDVVPEGLGGIYAMDLGGGARIDGRAIYSVIDEAFGGPDSRMLGAQGVLSAPLSANLGLSLAASYYDYRLHALAGADAGDFRSNLLSDGQYLSDFRLLDALATLRWSGLGERWPISLTGDFVRNLGAAVLSDSGFNIELSAGRAARRGDWRLFYNYSEVGVDAVFAAFSHDNLNLATNYRLHGLSLHHVPLDNVVLDATYYHYRPLDPRYAGTNQPQDWRDRVRFNLMLSF